MTKFLHELTKRGRVWMSSWTKHLEWWRSVALCQVERFFRYIQLFHSSSLFTGTHEPNKVTCSQLSCFLAQLAEHCNRGHGSESRCSHPDFSNLNPKDTAIPDDLHWPRSCHNCTLNQIFLSFSMQYDFACYLKMVYEGYLANNSLYIVRSTIHAF